MDKRRKRGSPWSAACPQKPRRAVFRLLKFLSLVSLSPKPKACNISFPVWGFPEIETEMLASVKKPVERLFLWALVCQEEGREKAGRRATRPEHHCPAREWLLACFHQGLRGCSRRPLSSFRAISVDVAGGPNSLLALVSSWVQEMCDFFCSFSNERKPTLEKCDIGWCRVWGEGEVSLCPLCMCWPLLPGLPFLNPLSM